MDYDSFSELGGEKYLNKALDIVNAVPRGAAKGWTMQEGDRNRYWLIENLTNVRMQTFRRAMYQYHLLGLDRLSKEETRADGITAIEKALSMVRDANQAYPATMLVQLFVNAKRDEILNIFTVADLKTRRKIYEYMVKLDGTHAGDYQKLTVP